MRHSFFDKQIYQENPDPKAEIGFVIFYPFQFYVFKNVYRHLTEEAEFIVDLGAFFPAKQPVGLLEEIVSLLNKHRANFRIFYHEDYSNPVYSEQFFSKYRTLISLWRRGCLRLNYNLNKKKIHLTYGAGKDLITYGLWKRFFDLILAYGKRDYDLFSLYTHSIIVGNPKFDDWFNNEFDEDFLSNLRLGLAPNKKNILYLPTYGDLCSVDDLAAELKKLTATYNIITKLHYLTVYEEPGRVGKLRYKNLKLFKDDADLLPLLKLADVVISDSSSVIFDAILADKPLVLTDFLPDEFLDIEHRKVRQYRYGTSSVLTYSGSIEQRLKKESLVLTIGKANQLHAAIESAIRDEPFFKNTRKQIREEIFAFRDGLCGKRAAEAIKNFHKLQELPPRPLLYHLIDIAQEERGESHPRRRDFEKISDFEKIYGCRNILFRRIDESYGKDGIFGIILKAILKFFFLILTRLTSL